MAFAVGRVKLRKHGSVAVFTLLLGSCGACLGYQEIWWRQAEAAVAEAVAATAEDRAPADVQVRLNAGAAATASTDFVSDYEISGADNYLAGTSWFDLVSPGIWVGHLVFSNAAEYHVEARKVRGRWGVSISTAEN